MAEEVNELVKQRIEKLEAIKGKGVYPYGGKFDKSSDIKELTENFAEGKVVRTAGRIMSLRSHGKTVFCDLKDQTGKLQIYIGKDFIGEEQFSLFEKVDIGDILGIEGELFKTRTGEKTVKVTKFVILSKSLRPLPEKWHGLKDIEIKYRQRYIDLIVNDDVREIFLLRSRVVSNIRNFLDSRGYIEVETPIIQPLPGGAAGEPFKTHHNVFDTDLYLRLAPELYLKKLLVGGFEKVYELNKSFRNEGISTRHNPEFTMLEVYTAYADYKDMMVLVRELITNVAREVLGKTEFEFNGQKIDLSKWEEISFAKMMKDVYDIEPEEDLNGWVDKLQKKGIDLKGERISRSFVVNIIEDLLKPKVSSSPIFVTDLFTELCPLAKTNIENTGLSERFELFIAGMEIANAYSELNDPMEQRARFERQIADGVRNRKIDEDFVLALEYGMPPAGGLGIGIDRLLMLFANQSSIRDVVLFPLLRPQGQE